MPSRMSTPPLKVSNNYWRIDYGKQKRESTDKANAQDYPGYLRRRNRGWLHQSREEWYKSPVRIVSHIEGTKITQSLVEKRARELKISPFDKVDTFLMYDMDVAAVNKK